MVKNKFSNDNNVSKLVILFLKFNVVIILYVFMKIDLEMKNIEVELIRNIEIMMKMALNLLIITNEIIIKISL